jgi:hypothetical protein
MSQPTNIKEHLKAMRRRGANAATIVRKAPAGSALAAINTAAEAIRAQRPELSAGMCIGMALQRNPSLYARYVEEEEGQ